MPAAIGGVLLSPPRPTTKEQRPLPNWAEVHRELKRPGVTLELLWQEYREQYPDGYSYSRFCDLFREWEKRVSPTMRQTHIAGEKMFVDYAGTKVQVIDGMTGEVLAAELCVAVLGASSLTYAEATWTQSLPDWIGAHKRALRYFGGVTAMIVSDNLKSGITLARNDRPLQPPARRYHAPGRTRCWRRACLGRIGTDLAERRQKVVQSVEDCESMRFAISCLRSSDAAGPVALKWPCGSTGSAKDVNFRWDPPLERRHEAQIPVRSLAPRHPDRPISGRSSGLRRRAHKLIK